MDFACRRICDVGGVGPRPASAPAQLARCSRKRIEIARNEHDIGARSATASAMIRPKPRLPPVMSTRLPSNRKRSSTVMAQSFSVLAAR
jgi:hypothetical protein